MVVRDAALAIALVCMMVVPAQAVPLDTVTTSFVQPRAFTSAIHASGSYYVFGGTDHGAGTWSSLSWSDDIVKFDPSGPTATVLATGLPTPRSHTTAVYDGSRYAYVFGGWDGGDPTSPSTGLQEVVRFDTATGAVATMAATLPDNRWGMSGVWAGGKAYLFGGYPCEDCPFLEYDPVSDSITALSSALPDRYYMTAAVYDGAKAYIFGGRSWTPTPTLVYDAVYQFDPATDSLVLKSATLPAKRAHLAAVWDGTQALVIGGRDTATAGFTAIYAYTPSTDTMTTSSLTLPAATQAHSAAYGTGEGYVFGGANSGTDAWEKIYCIYCGEPEADFSCVVVDPVARTVRFEDGSTFIATKPGATWSWNLGDGTTIGATDDGDVEHSYAGEGPYSVTLTVTDTAGNTDSKTRSCNAGNRAPVMEDIADGAVEACRSITTKASASDDDGDALTWTVDGDGLPGEYSFADGTLHWIPGGTEGTFGPITITVSDGIAQDSRSFFLTSGPCHGGTGGGTSPNTDSDEDGVWDHEDNCHDVYNPDQADYDGNGLGDACATYGLPPENASQGQEGPDAAQAEQDASQGDGRDGEAGHATEARNESSSGATTVTGACDVPLPTLESADFDLDASQLTLSWFLEGTCREGGTIIWSAGEAVAYVPFAATSQRHEYVLDVEGPWYDLQPAASRTDGFDANAAVRIGPLPCASCASGPGGNETDEGGGETSASSATGPLADLDEAACSDCGVLKTTWLLAVGGLVATVVVALLLLVLRRTRQH